MSDEPSNTDEQNETQHTVMSTGTSGKPMSAVDRVRDESAEGPETSESEAEDAGPPVDNSAGLDLVQATLAGAQAVSRTLPGRRGGGSKRRREQDKLTDHNRGRYSRPGPDPDRDPQRLGPLLAGYVEERGWQRPLAEARVFTDWPALVGSDVASHCTPQGLREGQLHIAAESSAWATQLRLLASTLLARLVAELGPQVVTKLSITGPVAPSWKHGNRSVRGHRGPRDTYG